MIGPPQIVISQTHPMDARSHGQLGATLTLEDTLCHVPEQVLWCGSTVLLEGPISAGRTGVLGGAFGLQALLGWMV